MRHTRLVREHWRTDNKQYLGSLSLASRRTNRRRAFRGWHGNHYVTRVADLGHSVRVGYKPALPCQPENPALPLVDASRSCGGCLKQLFLVTFGCELVLEGVRTSTGSTTWPWCPRHASVRLSGCLYVCVSCFTHTVYFNNACLGR